MDELKPVLVAVFLGFIASMSYGIAYEALDLTTSTDNSFNQSSFSNQSLKQ